MNQAPTTVMTLLPKGPRERWLLAGALFLGTALLYARVATFDFTYFDDPRYVTENLRVRAGLSWENVKWAFTTFHFGNWHPLTWLSYMLDVQLFGVDAGAMHVVNALLHAANAALVFLVLDRMTGARGRSLLVAVLFAAHPLHVESVAWVAERKDVLSTLFGLLALLAYGRYVRARSAARHLVVTLAFLSSLLAKPMWVTFPFLLLLLDLWPLRRIAGWVAAPGPPLPSPGPVSLRSALLEKTPWLLLSIASSALTLVAQHRGGAMTEGLGLGWRLANALVSYARYLGMTFWPAGLAAYYPLRAEGAAAYQVLAAGVLLAGISALALWKLRRQPWIAVGWAWFVGTLVPVIGVVQVGGQAVADRYTYLPSIGLFVAVVWGAHACVSRRVARSHLRLASVAIAAALAILSFRQAGYWSDHSTLFRHAIQVTGPNARAHAYLSDGLRRAGRFDEALAEAHEAIRIEPGSGRLRMTLALIQVDLGRLREAERTLREAVTLDPMLPVAWALLGEVETALGRPDEGERTLVRAARMAPDDADIAARLDRVRAYKASLGR